LESGWKTRAAQQETRPPDRIDPPICETPPEDKQISGEIRLQCGSSFRIRSARLRGLMKTLLRIEFRSQPQRESVAWFIAGEDPACWLEEISLWQVETSSLVLCIIAEPASKDELARTRTTCGVLVTSPTPIRPNDRQFAQPWGCVGDRLYLPVEAAIEPAAEDHEIATLLPQGDLLAWHPQHGLFGFDSDGLLRISDLLSPPRESDTRWDRAQPGPALARNLVSLTAEALPDAQDVIEAGQDDIGTESDTIDELPPEPGEPQTGAVKQAFEDFRKAVAKKVEDLTSKAPQTANKKTWIDGLNEWAGGVLNNSVLQKRRESLERLLRMLDNDPEAGLRKALPLGGDESHRGRSRPGSELGERDIDFRMPGQGSGPADYWDIPWEIQHQLLTKYRELANREIQLGRHRRAAYIFSNLLGDDHAAARTLEEGGHFLEAAALHRDRLKQPLEAARCLERGGVLHQAIEIYEQHAWFEDAAKLHEKLDQRDAARDCWSKSVKQARANRNYLHAAKLTREKLDEPDQALVILRSGWDQSIQPQDCLREWFRLSGELGEHDLAANHARELVKEDYSSNRTGGLVKVLAAVTASYPDSSVRLQTADAARVVASRQLGESSSGAAPLLNALREVDRSDRLLARDCDRFRTKQTQPAAHAKVTAENLQIEEVNFRRTQRLDQLTVAATHKSLYLAGFDEGGLFSAQKLDWNVLEDPGQMTPAKDSLAFRPAQQTRPLLAPRHDDRIVVAHVPGNMPYTCDPASRTQTFGAPPWIRAHGTVAVAWDSGGLAWHVARDESDLWLECYDAKSNMLSSRSLVSAIDDPVAAHMLTQADDLSELNIGLIAAHNRCFLRIGNNVYIIGPREVTDHVQIETSIFDMAVSPALTRLELAVSGGRGVYVFPDGQWYAPDILMTELRRPKVCYTRDGLLVGVDGDACIVEDTQGKQVARLEWSHREFPVAVVPTDIPVTFAVVFADGLVRIMRVV
jgi:tetratricopeptide (TPR) repeat protein